MDEKVVIDGMLKRVATNWGAYEIRINIEVDLDSAEYELIGLAGYAQSETRCTALIFIHGQNETNAIEIESKIVSVKTDLKNGFASVVLIADNTEENNSKAGNLGSLVEQKLKVTTQFQPHHAQMKLDLDLLQESLDEAGSGIEVVKDPE